MYIYIYTHKLHVFVAIIRQILEGETVFGKWYWVTCQQQPFVGALYGNWFVGLRAIVGLLADLLTLLTEMPSNHSKGMSQLTTGRGILVLQWSNHE